MNRRERGPFARECSYARGRKTDGVLCLSVWHSPLADCRSTCRSAFGRSIGCSRNSMQASRRGRPSRAGRVSEWNQPERPGNVTGFSTAVLTRSDFKTRHLSFVPLLVLHCTRDVSSVCCPQSFRGRPERRSQEAQIFDQELACTAKYFNAVSKLDCAWRIRPDEGHRLGKGRNLPAFRKQATACGRGSRLRLEPGDRHAL